MRRFRIFLFVMGACVLAGAPAWAQTPPTITPKALGSTLLVLSGGTVVDVTDWGRSARDLRDAIVMVRDGRIAEVGYRGTVSIPKGARVIDCTGKYLLPGLVDGYAGMNSQGQANANLYMGVTTVAARNDYRYGLIDFAANPSPHIYLIDSIGTTDNWSLLAKRPEWALKLREGAHPAELSPEDTARHSATPRGWERACCCWATTLPQPIRSGSLPKPTRWGWPPMESSSPRPTA